VSAFTKTTQTAIAIRALCLLGLIATLAGCASTPVAKPDQSAAAQTLRQQHLQSLAEIHQFSIQGRIGVQTNGKGFSGSMQWLHTQSDDNIALFSPLGSQVASIKKTPSQFTLEDASGKNYSAPDAETLTQEILGWRLPLKGLADWSIGRPTQGTVQNSIWNEQGVLTNLEQDGWKIEYSNYEQQGSYLLPKKIYLKSDQLNLKLLVEKWNQLEH
jgi:outer membrane lipoprotein LolB